MKEFFGIGGYKRPVEGFLSWQHLTFVTTLMIIMVVSAIILGKKYKNKDLKDKNKVLIWSAILIDGLELFKIIMTCIIKNDPWNWLHSLPLYLCSIQLIVIPLAAFSSGKFKEAALDFIFTFGLLGAVLGTYLASQYYSKYPVLSFDILASGLTHSIAGFASLYIVISNMQSMKKNNLPITFAILFSFGICAYIANLALNDNYMFLMNGEGTAYDMVYNLLNGNRILYPLIVMLLFVLYILVFNALYHLIKNKTLKQKNERK